MRTQRSDYLSPQQSQRVCECVARFLTCWWWSCVYWVTIFMLQLAKGSYTVCHHDRCDRRPNWSRDLIKRCRKCNCLDSSNVVWYLDNTLNLAILIGVLDVAVPAVQRIFAWVNCRFMKAHPVSMQWHCKADSPAPQEVVGCSIATNHTGLRFAHCNTLKYSCLATQVVLQSWYPSLWSLSAALCAM